MEANFRSEIKLLLVGAIISFISAFLTNWANERREDKKGNMQKRFELNEQISKDLGNRLFFTHEMYKRKNQHEDSLYKQAFNQYNLVRQEWNLKFTSYIALLEFYYGQDVQNNFITQMYNPMVALGQNASSPTEPLYKDFTTRHAKLSKSTKELIIDIYHRTYK